MSSPISRHGHELPWANIKKSKICESEKQKLLGIAIDRNLSFHEHILSQCRKASGKLTMFVRMSMKVFIESQFGYCHLV